MVEQDDELLKVAKDVVNKAGEERKTPYVRNINGDWHITDEGHHTSQSLYVKGLCGDQVRVTMSRDQAPAIEVCARCLAKQGEAKGEL